EPERRARKRDKHALVGTVRIPVDDVSSRYLNERWYPLSEGDKPQSPGGRAPPPPAPALRIKCRYQSVDVLPLDNYARFLDYLKRNYRRLCEYLEPVIGARARAYDQIPLPERERSTARKLRTIVRLPQEELQAAARVPGARPSVRLHELSTSDGLHCPMVTSLLSPAPALWIKGRYRSVGVLPLDNYAHYLDYLQRKYRRLCEYLEPVTGGGVVDIA
ncbi:hypothetical protein evm_015555, partial [Chilo suppressalis]